MRSLPNAPNKDRHAILLLKPCEHSYPCSRYRICSPTPRDSFIWDPVWRSSFSGRAIKPQKQKFVFCRRYQEGWPNLAAEAESRESLQCIGGLIEKYLGLADLQFWAYNGMNIQFLSWNYLKLITKDETLGGFSQFIDCKVCSEYWKLSSTLLTTLIHKGFDNNLF